MNTQIITLYRPVGLKEMELILETDLRTFPPRLPTQPVFYPVLNQDYATQIARDWNTKDMQSGYAGFVTEFDVDGNYVSQFEEHIVGSSQHRELWIPAEDLEEFNQNIQGPIRVVDAFYGDNYKGIRHFFNDWYTEEMFASLYNLSFSSAQDFSGEVTLNRNAIFLNFRYWVQHDLSKHVLYEGEQPRFLRYLRDVWEFKFPALLLPGSEMLNP